MIYLNLFYCFMILFQCNNVVILSLIHSYDIHFKFRFYHYVLRDEMNKIRSHLHIFKKINVNLIYTIFEYVYIYIRSRFMST
jgi:hypothetical protein